MSLCRACKRTCVGGHSVADGKEFVAEVMHCRRPQGAHRRALCLAMRAQPVGSNSEQDHLLFARRGPRWAAALMVSAAMLSGCSLASSVGSSDSSPSFASPFASFFPTQSRA